MRLLHLLKTASTTASILGGASIVLLALKLLLLNRFPSYTQNIYEIGVLVDAILASIFASYVFYFLVVHVQYQANRDHIRPFLRRHTGKIVQIARDQLQEVGKHTHTTLTLDSLTTSNLKLALEKLKLSDASPYMHASRDSPLTWKEFFTAHAAQTRRSVSRLVSSGTHMEVSLLAQVVDIDECSFFNFLDQTIGTSITNPNSLVLNDMMYHYFDLCRRLDGNQG